ncbi:alpha/beta hydrolase [Persicirhabdus sediminis]|uniref:Alpha/beta hydrolase n=1 Tax=Persicirhabdus sediminis TaxID=454144 RepID=A0A8J7SJK9_9BACT|nr:alpha/beta hydrolase [Persicirhabdus sediminis]MBK1792225.1 alpha/beta hydrolase [Persicirhabdus sediminis]
MKNSLIKCLLSLLATAAMTMAAQPEKVLLWPERNVSGPEHREKVGKNNDVLRLTDVKVPSITLYPLSNIAQQRPVVIVCPGGGYNMLAYDKEGSEVCEWLNSVGYHAVLLKYTVPGQRDAALADLKKAVSWVRENANQYRFNASKVGVMGFSAGGHLAARTCAGVDAGDLSTRPDFCILVYPAYLDNKQTGQLADEFEMPPVPPKTFVVHTEDDKNFIRGGKVYVDRMRKAGGNVCFKLYETGGHGYGLRSQVEPLMHWPNELKKWLDKEVVKSR